jgi:hypothetical protein
MQTNDRQKLIELIADAKYELHPGAHTYHVCKCDRRSTRRGECIHCILDKMEWLCLTKRERKNREVLRILRQGKP